MTIRKNFYRTPSDLTLTSHMLSELAYEEALRGMIIVCSDIVLVDRKKRSLLLLKRIVQPALGVWMIGGRRNRGESSEAAAQRHLLQDIGMEIAPGRLLLINENEYLWQIRKQPPWDGGTHNLAHTYLLEPTESELAHARTHISPNEYDVSFGIQPYTLSRLTEEGAHRALIDFYCEVFG